MILEYSESELQEVIAMWKFSLVGVLVGHKPLYHAMVQYVKKHWSVEPAISLTDRGVFVLRLDNQLDVDKILNVGCWTINGMYPLILKQWKPCM